MILMGSGLILSGDGGRIETMKPDRQHETDSEPYPGGQGVRRGGAGKEEIRKFHSSADGDEIH